MADNVGITPGSGATAAADDIGGILYQRVKVAVGADGVNDGDVSSANPLPTRAIDPSVQTSFGPITAANTVLFTAADTAHARTLVLQVTGLFDDGIFLQASHDNTTWFQTHATSYNSDLAVVDTITAPGLFIVPVSARFIRAITMPTFTGTVSGSYALRNTDVASPFTQAKIVDVDPGLMLPLAGIDERNNLTRIRANTFGQLIPADNLRATGGRNSVGPVLTLDTTGYNSAVVQLTGTWAGTVTFQASNDGATWSAVVAWPVGGAAIPVTTSTANGQWLLPCAGRLLRVAVTAYTSGTVAADVVLRATTAYQTLNVPSQNLAQIGGSAVSAATAQLGHNLVQVGGTAVVTGGVAGIQAIGGNIAVGTAPTANPIPLAWDGTNTRRILTDASSGGVVLGSSTVTNGQTIGRGNQTVTTPAGISIKGSAGRVTMLNVSQAGTVAGFLHLYNAASLTLGTTTDVQCYAIPATVGAYDISLPDGGLYFSAGIQAAFTAASTNNDNTAFGSAPTLILNYAFI